MIILFQRQPGAWGAATSRNSKNRTPVKLHKCMQSALKMTMPSSAPISARHSNFRYIRTAYRYLAVGGIPVKYGDPSDTVPSGLRPDTKGKI